jgi:hypothetical protein
VHLGNSRIRENLHGPAYVAMVTSLFVPWRDISDKDERAIKTMFEKSGKHRNTKTARGDTGEVKKAR